MDVKQRLAALKRQSGGMAGPQQVAPVGVAERIRRMRASVGSAVGAAPRRDGLGEAIAPGAALPQGMALPQGDALPQGTAVTHGGSGALAAMGLRPTPGMEEAALAEQLDGERLAPGLVLVTRRVALASHHGGVCLAGLSGRTAMLPDPEDGAPERWLLIDTETSGLSGGTGTVVFLLGLARVQGEALETRQYLLTTFSGEGALFEHASAWVGSGRTLVSFNGKSFDLPLLATRARMARVPDPFAELAHLDLLHATRRVYAARWSDCRLATAERHLLGFEREHDLPGAEVPGVWLDWLQRRDGSRLPGVLRHNHWDLVSLAALALRLGEAYREPGRWGADALAAARAWAARGWEDQARELLKSHRQDLQPDGLLELARLYRRSGVWAEACAIWRGLSAQGEVEASEQLAKYHEHVAKDYVRALDYAARLPAEAGSEHRRRRLELKLYRRGRQAALLP
jgi:hypothetical protein